MRYDTPALSDRIDSAFGVNVRSQRRAIVVVGAPVPFAIPRSRFDCRVVCVGRGLEPIDRCLISTRSRVLRKLAKGRAEKPGEPHALALSVHTNAIHSVVPVTTANQRKSVDTVGACAPERVK